MNTPSILLTIPGRIGGKQRAGRKFLGTRKVLTFNPPKTAAQEAVVRQIAALAMRGHGLMEGPVSVEITLFRRPPISWSKKKREAAKWITGKPDWDNIGKLISDALNGIVWIDDAQVANGRVSRMYDNHGPERVVVEIRGLV